jgi:O-antigen/teichoic acid export membrane protein
MSVIKRLASYAGVDICAALLGLITSPITTRLLSIDQYGAISYMAAVWLPFMVARYSGIDYSFVFFKARKGVDQNALLVACTKVVGISTVCVALFFLGFVFTTDVFSDLTVIGDYEILLFVLGLLPIAMVDWLLLMLRFAHKATEYAKISIVQKISVIIIALPAMYFFEQNERLLVYYVVAAVFPLISFAYAVSLMKKTGLRPFDWSYSRPGMLKELLSYGVFLVPGGILYSLIAVTDKLLVGALVGVQGVALLGLAIALSAPITMLKKWVSLVLNPLITDWVRELSAAEYSQNLNVVLHCLSVVFFPTVLLMTIWSQPVVHLLYTESYYESATMIPFLAFSGVLAVLTLVAISTVLITQKKSITLKVNLFALCANVGFSVYFIPLYGAIAAVWGTVLAEFLILILWGYLGAVHYKILLLQWRPVLMVAIGVFVCVFYGAFYFYSDVGVLERVGGSLLCLFLSALYGWSNIKNFREFRKLL